MHPQPPPKLSICPTPGSTLLLLSTGPHQILKARLPAPRLAHPRSAPMLLESLALWLQQPLSAVLYADVEGASSELGLCNSFGVGHATVHYDVEVVEPGDRRGVRLHGVGDFAALRRMRRRS